MKDRFLSDLLFQGVSLLIAIVVVHLVYVTTVLPQAEAIMAAQRAAQAAGEDFEVSQSLWIILKDMEQESCIVLSLWALAIIGQKGREVLLDRGLFATPLLDLEPGTSILPEDVRDYARPLQALQGRPRAALLPRALLVALQRFGATRNVQDAAAAVTEVCDTEADRMDSELAMLRYIIWAIPSIGFIGTVRGIGMALTDAQAAVEGNILGVTDALGTAFNSTLVALLVSMVIMFLTYQLQLLQERLVLDTQAHCSERLLAHFRVG